MQLIFATPWLLSALAVLPLIWWLLKVTPPAPKLMAFPPMRLLFGLSGRQETPAHTPPWLIALRLALATLLIVALSEPPPNPETRAKGRSEEHTSELQSQPHPVCRLPLEKKNNTKKKKQPSPPHPADNTLH